MKLIPLYLYKHKIKTIVVLVCVIAYYFSLPKVLFSDPTATVITSTDYRLLGAKIADDGQWRFPFSDSIPKKFETCIIQFEDAYFYDHPGFNPVSIFKALKDNVASKKVKRGGSTLTQQVIRLSRKGKPRTYFEKLKELILATRLEFRHSKKHILNLYCSNAPFGGNVIGLEAASWRYFNRSPFDLSWSECATLAVLPNAPSLIYPGKNQQRLLQKRNRLLKKLLENHDIDEMTYKLSLIEPLPQKPFPLPQLAPHLLQNLKTTHSGQSIQTSIDYNLQSRANQIVASHYLRLKQNEIYNIGVLIVDVETRKVISYIGNSPTDKNHQKDVDVINKARSTGSILKPFLYTAMLDSGDLLPNSLVPDIPTVFGNYKPQNYDKTFDGAVPAGEALYRSLNVPATIMLQDYGLQRFYNQLKEMKFKDLRFNANHYGLSLILGGAESNLWDLCKNYAAYAGTINHFNENSSQYFENEFCNLSLLHSKQPDFGKLSQEKSIFDAGSIFMTLKSMKQVNRPEGEENWEYYDSSQDIAWKTGTSFGFRDAWAIGATKNYVIGVWVGNADGEGRPGLVGLQAAAPILFDLYALLPKSNWFNTPFDELTKINVCAISGYRAGINCDKVENELVPNAGLKTEPCPYHITVHLDQTETYQVNTSCENVALIKQKSWFQLPPLMAYYYNTKNPYYKTLPPYRVDCYSEQQNIMEFIYPKNNQNIFLPLDFNETQNPVILKIAHSKPSSNVYWYLDSEYLGITKDIHELAISPTPGNYKLTVVDESGFEISKQISFTN